MSPMRCLLAVAMLVGWFSCAPANAQVTLCPIGGATSPQFVAPGAPIPIYNMSIPETFLPVSYEYSLNNGPWQQGRLHNATTCAGSVFHRLTYRSPAIPECALPEYTVIMSTSWGTLEPTIELTLSTVPNQAGSGITATLELGTQNVHPNVARWWQIQQWAGSAWLPVATAQSPTQDYISDSRPRHSVNLGVASICSADSARYRVIWYGGCNDQRVGPEVRLTNVPDLNYELGLSISNTTPLAMEPVVVTVSLLSTNARPNVRHPWVIEQSRDGGATWQVHYAPLPWELLAVGDSQQRITGTGVGGGGFPACANAPFLLRAMHNTCGVIWTSQPVLIQPQTFTSTLALREVPLPGAGLFSPLNLEVTRVSTNSPLQRTDFQLQEWRPDISPPNWAVVGFQLRSVLNSPVQPDWGLRYLRCGSAQRFRLVWSDGCGVTQFGEVVEVGCRPACDSIDFNRNDVFPEDQDVVDFFTVLAGGSCPGCSDIDFNNNAVFPEDQDVVDFFNALAGGTCPL